MARQETGQSFLNIFIKDKRKLPSTLLASSLLVALLTTAVYSRGFLQEEKTVTLEVNGRRKVVESRQQTVGGLLNEQGYRLTDKDLVYPVRAAPLPNSAPVSLFLARDITFLADGNHRRVLTHAETVRDFLVEQDVALNEQDLLLLDGRPVTPDSYLPLLPDDDERARGTLELRRAHPIQLRDDKMVYKFMTHEQTLGEALLAENILLHEGDHVTPDLDTPVTDNLKVRIVRARPVTISADGRTIHTRTRVRTVQDLLSRQGIELDEYDHVTPDPSVPIEPNLHVTVTRVEHKVIVEREPIPFERRVEFWDGLALDTEQLVQHGEEGILAREVRVIYVDGVEQERIVEREYVEKPPKDEIYGIGTKVVLRTVQTPEGPRQYWRRIRMLATSYTAATSGKSRSHPAYGITRTGVPAGYGVVAVDPRIVSLGSTVYVPGYGIAYAGDTGGAIKGRRIDLGYNEGNLRLWYNMVDVYVLTPVPPESQIRYRLP